MKVEVKEGEKAKYPYLGKHVSTGRVVLFIEPGTGVTVGGCGVGEYEDGWAEDTFTPFTGSVTLSN